MSPPNAENDPVHKGLHQLGQQIEGADPAPAPAPTPPADPVDNPVENPVEKGLHELGRQIEEAERATRGKPGTEEARVRTEGRVTPGPGPRRPEEALAETHRWPG